MNAAPQWIEPPSCITLKCNQLPAFKPHIWNSLSAQIATYFQQVLSQYQLDYCAPTLELPSILQLSDYLDCCEMDVFDALYALKQRGYHYELHGIDYPILLSDPLGRMAIIDEVPSFLSRLLYSGQSWRNPQGVL